jgi:hypothetical protein
MIIVDVLLVLAGIILEFEKCSKESEVERITVDSVSGDILSTEKEVQNEKLVHRLEAAASALHYASIGILSLFMLEMSRMYLLHTAVAGQDICPKTCPF